MMRTTQHNSTNPRAHRVRPEPVFEPRRLVCEHVETVRRLLGEVEDLPETPRERAHSGEGGVVGLGGGRAGVRVWVGGLGWCGVGKKELSE